MAWTVVENGNQKGQNENENETKPKTSLAVSNPVHGYLVAHIPLGDIICNRQTYFIKEVLSN